MKKKMKKKVAPISLGSFSTPGLRDQNQDRSMPSSFLMASSLLPVLKEPSAPPPTTFALWAVQVCETEQLCCVLS